MCISHFPFFPSFPELGNQRSKYQPCHSNKQADSRAIQGPDYAGLRQDTKDHARIFSVHQTEQQIRKQHRRPDRHTAESSVKHIKSIHSGHIGPCTEQYSHDQQKRPSFHRIFRKKYFPQASVSYIRQQQRNAGDQTIHHVYGCHTRKTADGPVQSGQAQYFQP